MSRAAYAAVFAMVAAATSIAPAYALAHYHGVWAPGLISVLCPAAAVFAGLLAFFIGRSRSGLPTVFRGIVVMLAAFICTIGVDLTLIDPTVARAPFSGDRVAQFAGGILFFSVFGLLGHGWYVLLIGAVTPLAARTIASRYVA